MLVTQVWTSMCRGNASQDTGCDSSSLCGAASRVLEAKIHIHTQHTGDSEGAWDSECRVLCPVSSNEPAAKSQPYPRSSSLSPYSFPFSEGPVARILWLKQKCSSSWVCRGSTHTVFCSIKWSTWFSSLRQTAPHEDGVCIRSISQCGAPQINSSGPD